MQVIGTSYIHYRSSLGVDRINRQFPPMRNDTVVRKSQCGEKERNEVAIAMGVSTFVHHLTIYFPELGSS